MFVGNSRARALRHDQRRRASQMNADERMPRDRLHERGLRERERRRPAIVTRTLRNTRPYVRSHERRALGARASLDRVGAYEKPMMSFNSVEVLDGSRNEIIPQRMGAVPATDGA